MEEQNEIVSARITLTVKTTAGFKEGAKAIIDGDTYWVTKVVDAHTVELIPEPGSVGDREHKRPWITGWDFLAITAVLFILIWILTK